MGKVFVLAGVLSSIALSAAASSFAAEDPLKSIHLMKLAKEGKNLEPWEVCGIEVRVDSLGSIQGMRMPCEDGSYKDFSLEEAKKQPLGASLKEFHGKVFKIKRIDCIVASAKVFNEGNEKFHPSQGGPVQILYQQNCLSQRSWQSLMLYVNRAGEGWEVRDANRNPVNCLTIDQGSKGIDEVRTSFKAECSQPVRKRQQQQQ